MKDEKGGDLTTDGHGLYTDIHSLEISENHAEHKGNLVQEPVGLSYFNGIKFLKRPSKMSRTK